MQANAKEDLEKQKQIIVELKNRRAVTRDEINSLSSVVKASTLELNLMKEHIENQKNTTRHGLLSIGKDKKNDMKPISHKLAFYSGQTKFYDKDEEKARLDAEAYLTVLQNVLQLEKICDKEVSLACGSLEAIRSSVRADLLVAMTEIAETGETK